MARFFTADLHLGHRNIARYEPGRALAAGVDPLQGPADDETQSRHDLVRSASQDLDRQPVLVGDLVRIRPLTDDDLDPLFAVASDPLIWEQHPSKERSERAGFERWFADAMASGGALVVHDLDDDSVVGSSRYWGFDPERREVEIGWTFLARSHWGGPVNADLKRLMVGHAFESGAVDTIVFRVHSHNLRSQRAVLKLGAVHVDTEVDRNGRGENHVYHLSRTAQP